jgi:murein DD-endopeptidase MepM/ murein hydrolase activator NlpD
MRITSGGEMPEFRTLPASCPVPAKYKKKISKRVGDTGPMWATFHKGTDWVVPAGTPIYASHYGTVVHSSNDGGPEGLYISVDWLGPEGMVRDLYFHLSRADVRVGEKIGKGEMIGLSGKTGNASGDHLHFQMQSGSGADREFFVPLIEEVP